MEGFRKKQKGITLMSLIITVIIMLILAGVSIYSAVSVDGLIHKVIQASEEYKISHEIEQIQIAYSIAMMNKSSNEVLAEDLQKELVNDVNKIKVTSERDGDGKKGLLVEFKKTDHYYFVENGAVRISTKEEFSKEITGVYAILYSDGDLRFNKTGKVNEEKLANGCTVSLQSENISKTMLSASSQPWSAVASNIKSVTFEEKVVPEYTSYWFYNCSNIEAINNLGRLETCNVLNMKSMFRNMSKITTLDLSTFDTSKVTQMHNMFDGCSSLKKVDLSSFNTKNVVSIYEMFFNCTSLADLDLSSFNTQKVTGMYNMFKNCTSLTELDLSSFSIENVNLMYGMFQECSGLTELDLSSFKTSKATSMSNMFSLIPNLKSLNICNLDTSNVKSMESMFDGSKNLLYIDMRSASFEKVTSSSWFHSFETENPERKIIVKDDAAKAWWQEKLGGSKVATVLTVLELEQLNKDL